VAARGRAAPVEKVWSRLRVGKLGNSYPVPVIPKEAEALSDTYIKIFFAAVLIAAIFSTVFILDKRDQQRARASLLKVQEELRNLSNNTGYTSPRKIITSAKSGKERYKARRAKPPQPQERFAKLSRLA
jgi:hypothetical protein